MTNIKRKLERVRDNLREQSFDRNSREVDRILDRFSRFGVSTMFLALKEVMKPSDFRQTIESIIERNMDNEEFAEAVRNNTLPNTLKKFIFHLAEKAGIEDELEDELRSLRN